MAGYRLTEEAQRDLRAIRDYALSNWGAQQSRTYLNRLRQTLEKLAEIPEIGLKREEELGPDVHSFPYVSHMLYYVPDSKGITVMAVLHQSRIPVHHLAQRYR